MKRCGKCGSRQSLGTINGSPRCGKCRKDVRIKRAEGGRKSIGYHEPTADELERMIREQTPTMPDGRDDHDDFRR